MKLNEVIKQRKRLQRGTHPKEGHVRTMGEDGGQEETPQPNAALPTLDLRLPASSHWRPCQRRDVLCNLPFPALGSVTLLTVAGSGAVNADV